MTHTHNIRVLGVPYFQTNPGVKDYQPPKMDGFIMFKIVLNTDNFCGSVAIISFDKLPK